MNKIKEKINILVFPCGNENAKEVLNSFVPYEQFRIYGGSSTNNIGELLFEEIINDLPFVDDPDFILSLNAIIKKFSIDYIFPTHDHVVDVMANHHDEILCKCIVPNKMDSRILRDKKETYNKFKQFDFSPVIFDSIENCIYPIFAKPRIGRLAEGSTILNNITEAKDFFCNKDVNDYVLSELLDGPEFTIECFTDTSGELKVCETRKMSKMVRGLFLQSDTPRKREEFTKMALVINNELNLRGLWYFQCKLRKGVPKLLEISQKVNGTMSILRMRGVNLPLLTVLDTLNENLSYHSLPFNVTLKRQLFNYYKHDIKYSKLIINLDTVLKANKSKNSLTISYLYQAYFDGIDIIAYSKYDNKILDENKLHPDLFNNMISDYNNVLTEITNATIYIDDDVLLRSEVSNKFRILTFDSSSIEMLINNKK